MCAHPDTHEHTHTYTRTCDTQSYSVRFKLCVATKAKFKLPFVIKATATSNSCNTHPWRCYVSLISTYCSCWWRCLSWMRWWSCAWTLMPTHAFCICMQHDRLDWQSGSRRQPVMHATLTCWCRIVMHFISCRMRVGGQQNVCAKKCAKIWGSRNKNCIICMLWQFFESRTA